MIPYFAGGEKEMSMQRRSFFDFVEAAQRQINLGVREITIPAHLVQDDIPWREYFVGQLRPQISDCGTKLLFAIPTDQTVDNCPPDMTPGHA